MVQWCYPNTCNNFWNYNRVNLYRNKFFTGVTGAFEFFADGEDLDLLVGAGYFIYDKQPETDIYCIRECTTGMKTGDNIRGNLNAVTPVVTFASAVYVLTDRYLARYNITQDTIDMIKLAVQALTKSYVGNALPNLGAKLKQCVVTRIEELDDGIKIYYGAKPQRSLNFIDNDIEVSK